MGRYVFPSLIELCHSSALCSLKRILSAPLVTAAPLYCVDGTCGNGHDTLFLATKLHAILLAQPTNRVVKLIAFDIQPAAIAATHHRLAEAGMGVRVLLHNTSHEHLAVLLEKDAVVGVAVYNLGYLPGADKSVVTQSASTLISLEAAAGRMVPGGLLAVHVYGGHEGGQDEAAAVDAWFHALPKGKWHVAQYSFCNKQRNPETLYLAERRAMRLEQPSSAV